MSYSSTLLILEYLTISQLDNQFCELMLGDFEMGTKWPNFHYSAI